MCSKSMNTKECFKSCNKGWHIKGTKFNEGPLQMQNVQQSILNPLNMKSTYEFPTLQQMQNKTFVQSHYEHSHEQPPQMQGTRVPPPQRSGSGQAGTNITAKNQERGWTFKCQDCPAMFENKNKLSHHFKTAHANNEALNKSMNHEDFLEAVSKSLEKLLPKTLETILLRLNQNQIQTGPDMQQVGWGLVRQNFQ